MNTAKSLFYCFFCTALVFAQQPSEETPFNTLRGFAYNPYRTLGAAPAIQDILQKPSDIYGRKFVYVSPVSSVGYSAFDLAGGSALLGFDQSLILGYAKSFYGILLAISPNKFCSVGSDDYECTYVTKDDYIDLRFSVPLSNSIIYASVSEADALGTSSQEINKKKASIGITGGNTLAWDFRLAFEHQNSTESYSASYYDLTNTYTKTNFLFNIGYKILQSDRFKFIVGLNNLFYWEHIKIEAYLLTTTDYFSTSYDILHAIINPNFLGEVVLTEHLLAFVGAGHSIVSTYNYGQYYSDDTLFISDSNSGAYLGLRYERKNWAVEARLQSDVFGEVLSGESPFIGLGGFIWLMI